MQTIKIDSSIGHSLLLVGESLKNVKTYLPDKKTAIITDENIFNLYGADFPKVEVVIKLQEGEENKTFDTIQFIFDELVKHEFDRSSYILAIGGGIVCDVAGFAASTFMRGINFGFISTTLLSQVDASVGGKNGINFRGFKNMVGTFNLPQFVICDPKVLQSLSKENLLCGMGEVVKHGAIADAELFSFIEKNTEKALAYDAQVLQRFVYDSVVIKSDIVNKDAKEKGERKKLNFGHTFGHAIEKVQHIPHGMAISIGMVVAAELSVSRGLLARTEADRLINVLQKLELPTKLSINADDALNALKRDKKREGDKLHFILLKRIGEAVIQEITIKELEEIVNDLCVHTK